MLRKRENNHKKNHNEKKQEPSSWEQDLQNLDNLNKLQQTLPVPNTSPEEDLSVLQYLWNKIKAAYHNTCHFLSAMASKIKSILHTIWHQKDVIRDIIKNKHRFVVMDSQTYKEKISFQLTGINLFVVLGLSMIILIILTTLIISLTPLREFIPGYTNTKMTEQTFQNAIVIDSLETQLQQQELMIAHIKAIIAGENPEQLAISAQQNTTDTTTPKAYTHSKEDSLLRAEIESADKYTLSSGNNSSNNKSSTQASSPVSTQLFFTPMKGKVIASYDPKIKHYGVDIAGATNEVVKSILSGTVLMAEFTVETGYVLIIQHPGNYISVYKHNSALLKHEGEIVRAGEPIAYLGNSGQLTTGPHLHFELWSSGKPVNPLQYISF